MSYAKKNLFGVFLVSLVALSGCALTKANVKLAYLTDPAKKSPLSALTPMTLFLQLEDLRKMKNSKQVGNKRNSYNPTFPIWFFEWRNSGLKWHVTPRFSLRRSILDPTNPSSPGRQSDFDALSRIWTHYSRGQYLSSLSLYPGVPLVMWDAPMA